jgi:hypothetical protein
LITWLPTRDVGFGSPQGSSASMAEFAQFYKKNHILTIMAAQPHYLKRGMLPLLWLFFITSDSWHLFYTGFFSTSFENTTILCLQHL